MLSIHHDCLMFTNLMVDAGLLVHGAPEARAGDPDQRPPEHRDMSTLRSTERCLGADTDGTSHLSRQAEQRCIEQWS